MPVPRSALQSRAASGQRRRASPLPTSAGEGRRDGADPLDPLELGAEPGLVGAAAEVGHPALQGPLAVLLEEEPGVGQAGAQHPLVAVARHLGVAHRRAGDGHELVGELPLPVHHREVALVVPHLGDDHLGRQGQVGGLELAEHRGRVLHQVGDLLDQALVGADHAAALPGRGRQGLLDGRLAARPGRPPPRPWRAWRGSPPASP